MKTHKLLVFPLLIAIAACNFVGNQELSPLATPSQPTSTLFLTLTASPVPSSTFSPTPETSERSCTSEDFKTTLAPPDINRPQTLIGFRPSRDWLPSDDWIETHRTYYPEFDYSIQGYESSDLYLFVLERSICRYNENKFLLHEIKDYILISNLNDDQVIFATDWVAFGDYYRENVSKRLNFTWEMHTLVRCANSYPWAITIAKYNINEFPEKIDPGTEITFVALRGWLPNPSTYKFEEFDVTGISCTILFGGM